MRTDGLRRYGRFQWSRSGYASHCVFGNDERNRPCEQENQPRDEKRPTAVRTHHAGEAPDVAGPDGGTDGSKNQTETAVELVAFAHAITSVLPKIGFEDLVLILITEHDAQGHR